MSDRKTYDLSSFSDPSVTVEQERLLVMEGLVEGSMAYRIGDKSGRSQVRAGRDSTMLQAIKKATSKKSRSISKGKLRAWKKGIPFDDDTKDKAPTKGYAD